MSTDGGKVLAPLTDDQIASLNAYQESEYVHPYTCGSQSCPGRDLIGDLPMAADRAGLHCIGGACGHAYTQTWAHAWTADWSWRQRERHEMRRSRRSGRKALRTLRRHMRIFAGEPVFTRRDWIRLAVAVLLIAAVIAVAHSPIGSWRFL